MSSTLKNLLFWVVLIVVGILIWNFSSNFQQRDTPIPFSQFVETLDKGDIDALFKEPIAQTLVLGRCVAAEGFAILANAGDLVAGDRDRVDLPAFDSGKKLREIYDFGGGLELG